MTGNNSRRDILLDFTSLLDITLIILFFFIIFGSVQSEARTSEIIESASAAQAEADEKMHSAEELEKQAEEKTALAEQELQMLEAGDAEKSDYYTAFREFATGSNIKLIYSRIEGKTWRIEVRRGERILGTIEPGDDAPARFLELLEGEGYSENSFIMCEFIYDYDALLIEAENVKKEMIRQARRRYTRFVVSETDISRR